jgi:hypothetical protein
MGKHTENINSWQDHYCSREILTTRASTVAFWADMREVTTEVARDFEETNSRAEIKETKRYIRIDVP